MDGITLTSSSTLTSTSGTSSTTSSSSSVTESAEDAYELFLTVLTTQLETQNPTDPVDVTELSSQLVGYAQLEQQMQTNDYLAALIQATAEQTSDVALSFLGTDVAYGSSAQDYAGGALTWTVEIPDGAQAVTLEVVDAAGETVFETTADSVAAGSSLTFTWDGSLSDAEGTADAGTYSLIATAAASDGSTATLDASATSRATQVTWSSGEPELVLANGTTISLDSVIAASAAA